MEELDRELRLAQDACQRLKSQVSVSLCYQTIFSLRTLTMVVLLLGVAKTSAKSFQVIVYVFQSVLIHVLL